MGSEMCIRDRYYVSDYSSSSADEVISKRIEFSSEEMAKIAKNIPVIVEVIVKK